MASSVENPVASFEAGIVTVKGEPVGICVKFRYFDGTGALSHWPTKQLAHLIRGLLEYGESGRHDQFMFKASANPQIVDSLPPRHPYHTLLNERPELSADEVGMSSPKTRVTSCIFVDRGPTFVLRPEYADGSKAEIFMHEYTVFSLWGYLQEYIKAYDMLSAPHVGPVQ